MVERREIPVKGLGIFYRHKEEGILKSLVCLHCGGTNASYATQCLYCHRVFKQAFVENSEANKQISRVLTEYRQGKSLEAIATSLNAAGVGRLDVELPWDKQSIAFIVHQFTRDGFDKDIEPTVNRCEKCSVPLMDALPATPLCHVCQSNLTASKPIRRDGFGLAVIIFNTLVVGGLILFIALSKAYLTDGEGFNSQFGVLLLSIGAIIIAGIVFLIGNLCFILVAIFKSKK